MKGFLDYVPGNSVFHKMNPITKLIFAFAVCIGCFMSKNLIVLASFLVLNFLIGCICGIPKRTAMLLKGLMKLSFFLFILQVLFIRSGDVIQIPNFVNLFRQKFLGHEIEEIGKITLEWKILNVTYYGVWNALCLVLRLSCGTLPLAVMLSVTKLGDLSNALVEKVHLPFKYAFTLTTAIRFIPVFASEMAGIIEAQTSRGIQLDTKNPFKKISLILPLCAPLLVSSVRKTQSLAIAADLRGFKYRKAGSCLKKYPFKFRDFAAFFAGACVIAVSVICNNPELVHIGLKA